MDDKVPEQRVVDKDVYFVGPRFGPVLYDPQKQEQAVREVCERFVPEDDGDERSLGNLMRGLLLTAPFLKHPCYREEVEWRMISGHISIDGVSRVVGLNDTSTVVRRAGISRYDSVPLEDRTSEESENYGFVPIVMCIRLGPRNGSFEEDVKAFILEHRHDWRRVDILRSQTSYRGT